MRSLIPHFIQEHYQQEQFKGQFDALTMFVDVSGFTPMTQALMQHGTEGAEILAGVLNGIFDDLVNAVYQRGGFVSVFAGDAFTAVFPLDTPGISANLHILHVFACIAHIQTTFLQRGIQTTPYGQFPLQFKVGLSAGRVNWGIVGKTDRAYFFRGPAIDACAAAEHHAAKGDIIFDDPVAQTLRKTPRLPGGAWSVANLPGGFYQLRELPSALTAQVPAPDLPPLPDLDPAIAARFVPEILCSVTTIGEFRQVTPVFISFEGIAALSELDAWITLLLENLQTFGGYFNLLDFGDKGGVVLCGFGAPLTHENPLDRALDFILAVKAQTPGIPLLANLKFRAGLTSGNVYAGIAGGRQRCTYTYYGEVVNLAARFMAQAAWGEIYVSEAVYNRTVQFTIEEKGTFAYKGFAGSIPTYTLLNRKSGVRHRVFWENMVGRQAELTQLQQFAAPIFQRRFAGVACIQGEAGIGKSRLAFALQETLAAPGSVAWFNCPCDQILQKPFNPWIACLTRYFEQSPEQTPAANTACFEKIYQTLIAGVSRLSSPQAAGICAELTRAKSVLAAQLGLFSENSLWEQLDAKGKFENTLAAVKNFFLAHSLLHPTVIELEDAHWLDSDSSLLLHAFTRNMAAYPLMILATLRCSDDGSPICLIDPQAFAGQTLPYLVVNLAALTEQELRAFVEDHLSGAIDAQVYGLLFEKSRGNPFYAEQLLHYFLENGFLGRTAAQWRITGASGALPDTLQAVLIARIDRLTSHLRELVKTAAVLGREFDVQLLSAMLQRDVRSEVKLVERSRIWEAVQELLYVFKHALLRDAAYAMQLKARRQELHRLAAEAITAVYAGNLSPKYADLAFHYEHANLREQAIEYLRKAGDQAKTQYHNQQALNLYDRLLAQLRSTIGFTDLEIDALLQKAEILELIGEWQTCRQVCEEALRLAEQLDDQRRMGEAQRIAGIIFQQTGKYDNALKYFGQALEIFETVNERKGMGNVLRSTGLTYWYKGNANEAMTCYEQSLRICEEIEDKPGIAKNAINIGIIWDLKGDYDTAMRWYEKSLQICKEINERLEIARVLNNIGVIHDLQGDCNAARAYYEDALQIHEELGEKRSIAMDFGNIGGIYKLQGHYDMAINYFDRAITIDKEIENRYYLSGHFIDKAEALFAVQHYAEAQVLNQEGLRIAKDIGRKNYIFQGKILSAKIDFASGKQDAPCCLEAMLQQTSDDEELAALHYELWKMTRRENNRETALKFYQLLYKNTPQIDYKTRIEDMLKNSPCE